MISPKMCENKTERCPVAFFFLLRSERLVELWNMGSFYLAVIDAPLTDIWYKNRAMGINTINTMLSRLKKKSPLAALCANKKKQPAGKTTFCKLKSFGFPKYEIKNITGHISERGLHA